MKATGTAADLCGKEENLTRSQVDWSLTHLRDRALDRNIVACVGEGERVLDLGCGQGDLLARLKREKRIRERGVEIDGLSVTEAISRGLSVVHGDLEEALSCQTDGSFDVVILNHVINNIHNPVSVLEESVRVGRRAVVTFPNFAHWRNRLHILLTGRLPVTPSLPYQWFDTPNIRVMTVRDFRNLCRGRGFRVEREEFVASDQNGRIRTVGLFPGLRATSALFLLSSQETAVKTV